MQPKSREDVSNLTRMGCLSVPPGDTVNASVPLP
jgi:hypothetical protein